MVRFLISVFISVLISETAAFAAGPEFLSRNPSHSAKLAPQLDAADTRARLSTPSRVYPFPKLEAVTLGTEKDGSIELLSLPSRNSILGGKIAAVSQHNDLVYLSLDPKIQAIAEQVIAGVKAPHVAVVAMDPRTGRILGMADRSTNIEHLATHAGFPAASIFKIVTAAAAIEQANVAPSTKIAYRGNNYTLNYSNYLPSARYDRRAMSLTEALAKSVNPVFGRVALKYLSAGVIGGYARQFGFNSKLDLEFALPASAAAIPSDNFGLSRTAAGFGNVTLSPVHAAAMISGIANGGLMPRPILVDRVVTRSGTSLFEAIPRAVSRMVSSTTAHTLLKMMESTTTIGTSMREFNRNRRPALPSISVAAKTGTLRGKNPAGLNTWFVGTAPSNNPEIAIAVIVVNPSNTSSRACGVARRFLQGYFSN